MTGTEAKCARILRAPEAGGAGYARPSEKGFLRFVHELLCLLPPLTAENHPSSGSNVSMRCLFISSFMFGQSLEL